MHARRSIVLYTLSQVVRVRVMGLVVLSHGAPFTLTQQIYTLSQVVRVRVMDVAVRPLYSPKVSLG